MSCGQERRTASVGQRNLNTGDAAAEGCGESGKSIQVDMQSLPVCQWTTTLVTTHYHLNMYLQRIVEYARCRLAQAGDCTADGKH